MDSRTLVDTFLSEDRPFAATLRESQKLPQVMPAIKLSPDAERRLIDDARERAHMKMLLIALGIAVAGFVALSVIGMGAFLAYNR